MDVCIVGQTPNCSGESGCREISTGRAHALTATSRSGEFAERGEGGGVKEEGKRGVHVCRGQP